MTLPIPACSTASIRPISTSSRPQSIRSEACAQGRRSEASPGQGPALRCLGMLLPDWRPDRLSAILGHSLSKGCVLSPIIMAGLSAPSAFAWQGVAPPGSRQSRADGQNRWQCSKTQCFLNYFHFVLSNLLSEKPQPTGCVHCRCNADINIYPAAGHGYAA